MELGLICNLTDFLGCKTVRKGVVSGRRKMTRAEQVMVDYNQSLSVPDAIGRVQLFEEEALVWMKEPTRADDFAGHARIAAECRTPIQIGENLWGPHDLTKRLSVGALDFVMLDVMKIGGITGWLRAVSQAHHQPRKNHYDSARYR